jgi:putative MFS transporter
VISERRLIILSGVGWLFDAMDVLLLSYLLLLAAAPSSRWACPSVRR